MVPQSSRTSSRSMVCTCVAVLCSLLLVVNGCSPGHDASPTTPTAPVNTDRLSFRWIENPVLDLMSPEGTFVRAAVESLDLASFSQLPGWEAVDAAYPGFRRAYNNVIDPEDVYSLPIRPGQTVVGTGYYEVIDVTRDGDRYTAAVCSYPSLRASRQPDGTYRGRGSTAYADGRIITFGPDPRVSAEQQRLPPAGQKGSALRPDNDVFGTWVIFETTVLIARKYPQCEKLAPGTPTDWPPDPFERSEPPPMLTPEPGWPDPGAV